jgi:rhodanese-related sulfurtransferase
VRHSSLTVMTADLQEDLSPEQAAELLREGHAQLLDVREPYEHEAGRIEASTRVDLETLGEAAQQLDPARPVLLYCRTGSRSAVATQAFRAAGYDAYNMRGGLAAWVDRGLPIEPEGGTVAPH